MAIVLIDNKDEELEVLGKALENGWGKFVEMSGFQNLTEPKIIKIKYDKDSGDEQDLYNFANDFIGKDELISDDNPVFILVDLFLTNKEEDDKGPQKQYEEYSGFKLATTFNRLLQGKNFNISLMSKFFKKGASTATSKFGRLIHKPLYRAMNRPVLRYNHTLPMSVYCSLFYALPENLDTRDVVQAFCNIVFHKHKSLLD